MNIESDLILIKKLADNENDDDDVNAGKGEIASKYDLIVMSFVDQIKKKCSETEKLVNKNFQSNNVNFD